MPYDKRITEAQMSGLSVIEYTQAPITEIIKNIWEQIKNFTF